MKTTREQLVRSGAIPYYGKHPLDLAVGAMCQISFKPLEVLIRCGDETVAMRIPAENVEAFIVALADNADASAK